jgi:hypothetical protein
MGIIIYGPDKPKIGFKQLPDGSINFVIENESTVEFEESWKTITWRVLYKQPWALHEISRRKEVDLFREFTSDLANLTGSNAERKFFLAYVEECLISADESDKSVWSLPALIPQAWVNWIHYDPTDSKRAERAQKEPFRVDFMLKDNSINENLIIIEIDGSTHFASEEAYTKHIQKDRWLRKQGWQVYRISNSEVEQFRHFNDFYYEITGKYLSIPF